MTRAVRHVAVIDVGRTNAKLVLVDRATGGETAVLSRANRLVAGPPYSHYDIDGLWSFFLDGLAEFGARHPVDGISITTHGATAVLMAGDGPALPVLDYEHDGPDELAADYGRQRPDFAEGLSPRLPGGLNLGAQIHWLAQRFPDEFARVTAILMYPQYWAFRLTGRGATEVTSLGCHTDLWSPAAGDFSRLVDMAGWRPLFPPLAPAASVVGSLTPGVAARTGLAATMPVACGIHDSNASLLPYLNTLKRPFTVVSSGTWTIVMTVGGDIGGLDAARDCLAYVDATGAPVPAARFMGGREYGLLAGEQGADAEPAEADIAAVIGKGVMALPGFVPGTGPYPGASGRWEGDPDALGPAGRAAAASLYLALMTRTCLELAGVGDRIVVEGPLAANVLFCRVLAALADKPVDRSPDATGTSLGAAMLFDRPGDATRHPAPISAGTLRPDGLAAYAARWSELAGRG